MSAARVAILGHIGALARATTTALQENGHLVSVWEDRQPPERMPEIPQRILCFPFSPSLSRRSLAAKESDLSYLQSLVTWASNAGVRRVVMRSHVAAHGASMKNPGLLEDERPSLLPKTSTERRWLEAEHILFEGARAPLSVAAVRLASILDPAEEDLVARMLSRNLVAPLAGYDPQLQLMALEDAAGYLAAAVLSDAGGLFNAGPDGTVPAKAAFKAAVPLRIQTPGVLQKAVRDVFWKAGAASFPGEAMDRIKYNCTVASDKARERFGFVPRNSSSQALKLFLKNTGRGKPGRVKDSYDEFGLDPDYLARLNFWFRFLTRIYWRVEIEGMENVPSAGAALLTANHRGFMPFDGVVHRASILEAKSRHIRFLVIPSLFKCPFLSDFLVKQGGVVASQANTRKLFARESLVGIFPEGISGAFRMYRGAYKLGEMSKNAFARMALEHSVPIIPSATIGHVEIFPILARVRSSFVVRTTGWPFLPITPTFPLLPIPLPTKWHIRYLDPVPVNGSESDSRNSRIVDDLAGTIREIMQRNIDEMLRRRKHIFFGKIFDDSRSRPPAGTRACGIGQQL